MEYPKDLLVFALRECYVQMNLMTTNLHYKGKEKLQIVIAAVTLTFKL